ncbi:galactoside alpha-(1,2)-fucosyltransferase 2-like [Mixophyes fleayi]|uniref:galactoside alpha-(1,2)-fucosyltransferase 2-like n=1 Tax=Mixophyes fleayi TaxID=3061075 RepID=UPI003F4D79D3
MRVHIPLNLHRFLLIFCLFMIIFTIFFSCFQYYSKRQMEQKYAMWKAETKIVAKPCTKMSKKKHIGIWTINSVGRLGNQMGLYATLYALAKLNMRQACILPQMHHWLTPIFKVTLPVISTDDDRILPWKEYVINNWMSEQYKNIHSKYVKFIGHYNSWTFYHHIRNELVKEFTFHSFIKDRVTKILRKLRGTRNNPTYIGVHVRRGDYIDIMPNIWKGVIADRAYLEKAMAYFRNKYQEPVFVMISNGMNWCKDNIDNSRGDVYFAGDGIETSPLNDFAILVHCNHTIMTIGTFGYWAAYLAGGETIYLTNFTLPESNLLKIFRYEDSFLPEWIGIAANMAPLLNSSKERTRNDTYGIFNFLS